MRAFGDEEFEILPLVVVVQVFPARPSSLPEIRDFVRRRLTATPLSEEGIRILSERVAEVLLVAAGLNGAIQVSLRIFPDHAEIDVLHAERSAAGTTAVAGAELAGPVVRAGPVMRAGPVVPGDGARVGPDPAGAAIAVVFADWFADALRREGMTMEATARQLGVSVKTVSRWVAGTTQPRLRDLTRIREVFGALPFP
jgi:Helix-turn-helix